MWVVTRRSGLPVAAQALSAEPLPLSASPGWMIYALRRTDDGLTGPMITVVPGEPVLRGNTEQVRNWSNAILVALPIIIGNHE